MRLISSVLAATLFLAPWPARTVEINGQTSFVAVPTKARLVNYRWYAFEGRATYYVVLEFPQGAEAGLGGISLEQIRGVQPAFSYGAVPVKAFIGTPRREGRTIPAIAEFTLRHYLSRFPGHSTSHFGLFSNMHSSHVVGINFSPNAPHLFYTLTSAGLISRYVWLQNVDFLSLIIMATSIIFPSHHPPFQRFAMIEI